MVYSIITINPAMTLSRIICQRLVFLTAITEAVSVGVVFSNRIVTHLLHVGSAEVNSCGPSKIQQSNKGICQLYLEGGTVRPAFDAYMAGEAQKPAVYGINWANVWKRLLPQAITKGQIYGHLGKKLYVILQEPLLAYIISRGNVAEASDSKAEIIFHSYDYTGKHNRDGILELGFKRALRTTVADLQTAFLKASIEIELHHAIKLIERNISDAPELTDR